MPYIAKLFTSDASFSDFISLSSFTNGALTSSHFPASFVARSQLDWTSSCLWLQGIRTAPWATCCIFLNRPVTWLCSHQHWAASQTSSSSLDKNLHLPYSWSPAQSCSQGVAACLRTREKRNLTYINQPNVYLHVHLHVHLLYNTEQLLLIHRLFIYTETFNELLVWHYQ